MNNNINSDTKDNGNNSITHLSFEDYFESDWRKHFQEKDTVQSILEAAGLSYSHDFVQINSRYLIDNNRVAVIALVRRKNTEVLDKLIIDIIAGDPSFEQFIDVVYNIGSDCDYRMILHDQNSKNRTPGIYTTENIMHMLIESLDGHLFLYWMNVDAVRDEDHAMKVNYTAVKSATKFPYPYEMPNRRDFEYAELYCYTMSSFGDDSYWEIEDLQLLGGRRIDKSQYGMEG